MGRILLAFRAFFAVLYSGQTAARVSTALLGVAEPTRDPEIPRPVPAPRAEERPRPEPRPEPRRPIQSEAITLLATLQREARLVDFLKEDLTGYADEQVGAAVRAIQQDAAKVLDRLFALQAILTDEEGASVVVPAGFDAARYRLAGKVAGQAPFSGTLRHHGWEATRCEMPLFTGSESAARTVAPAEIEIG